MRKVSKNHSNGYNVHRKTIGNFINDEGNDEDNIT